MSPVAHLFASWVVAAKTTDNLRDRRLVALSGLVPDLDGAGMAIDLVRQATGSGEGYWFYQKYHHLLLHGVAGAVAIALVMAWLGRSRLRVFWLSLIVVHLHLVCDLVGSRGPSPEDVWPIHYLGPFSYHWTWFWRHQWALDAWQNRLIALGLFGWCLQLALRLGDSPVGVFQRRADEVFVGVIRGWARRLGWGKESKSRIKSKSKSWAR